MTRKKRLFEYKVDNKTTAPPAKKPNVATRSSIGNEKIQESDTKLGEVESLRVKEEQKSKSPEKQESREVLLELLNKQQNQFQKQQEQLQMLLEKVVSEPKDTTMVKMPSQAKKEGASAAKEKESKVLEQEDVEDTSDSSDDESGTII
ncbi:hypothetical protein QAD02_000461 [Eretmocerus hayati]|uniref:Uncharacterized protein n=1 Tax=Eretmocerus hayati TaxID=131215 RepID=A0ACC2NDP0_9HYME|nr:hypothetical protein QAD02_000461 [Eretmocerus hayati]